MGCNCRKGRTAPLGTGNNRSARKPLDTSADMSQPTGRDPKAAQRSARLGTGRTQSFTLEARDGSTQTFGSRLEAQAARVRTGGGTVKPV